MTVHDPSLGGMACGTHSPCIGVCSLDATTGLCLGCARTGLEISSWSTASELEKQRVWQALPERLERLGSHVQPLPWSPEGLLQWATRQALACDTRWTIGLGPVRSTIEIRHRAAAVTVLECGSVTLKMNDTGDGGQQRLHLRAHEKLRAFAFGAPRAPTSVALVLPRGRVSFTIEDVGSTITNDRAAEPTARALGFTVTALAADGARSGVVAETGTRVVETECARIERDGTEKMTPPHEAAFGTIEGLPSWAAVVAICDLKV
ncbi:MAG: DUF1289 domain-containing protein [Hyphomicrobiaceae bacterium]